MYSVQWTVCNGQYEMCSLHCAVYIVQCTVCNVQLTPPSLNCAVLSVQCLRGGEARSMGQQNSTSISSGLRKLFLDVIGPLLDLQSIANVLQFLFGGSQHQLCSFLVLLDKADIEMCLP